MRSWFLNVEMSQIWITQKVFNSFHFLLMCLPDATWLEKASCIVLISMYRLVKSVHIGLRNIDYFGGIILIKHFNLLIFLNDNHANNVIEMNTSIRLLGWWPNSFATKAYKILIMTIINPFFI